MEVRLRVHDCSGYPDINKALDVIFEHGSRAQYENIERESSSVIFTVSTEDPTGLMLKMRQELKRLVVRLPEFLYPYESPKEGACPQ
jgi:hypothetical protein